MLQGPICLSHETLLLAAPSLCWLSTPSSRVRVILEKIALRTTRFGYPSATEPESLSSIRSIQPLPGSQTKYYFSYCGTQVDRLGSEEWLISARQLGIAAAIS